MSAQHNHPVPRWTEPAQDRTDLTQASVHTRQPATLQPPSLSDSAPRIGTWEWQFNTNRVTCPPETVRILGLSPESCAFTFDWFLSSVHEADRPLIKSALHTALSDRRICHFEYRIVTPAGTVRWISCYGRPVITAEGTVSAMAGTVDDVTRHKDTERALQDLQRTFEQHVRERTGELHQTIQQLQQNIERHRETAAALSEREARYRVLYEQNPSMYFTLDADGIILSVNQFGANALGYRPDELTGQSVLQVFQPSDHDTILHQLRTCSRSPETTFDWEIQKIRKDGSRLWVKERARSITAQQGCPMTLVVCEDITDRRRAEEAARENAQRLRRTKQFLDTLVREAPLPIISLDAHGTVTSWNQAATTLFGWTADEVMGGELPYIPPGREAEADALWEQGTRQMVRGPIALHRQHKDGTPLDLLLWPVFIHDEDEQVSTAVGLYVDQSDLQRAEADLRESEERLRAFAATFPGLAFILDEHGRYLDILGYENHLLYADASLVKGRLLHDVLPQTEADHFLAIIRQTVDTGQSQRVEYPLPVKAGLRWFEGRTSLMQPTPGKARQVVWIAHDISDRKRAEEALRVSEERYAKAFRSSPHPIIITERDTGRCLEVNEAGLALFGYRREEVVGQTVLALRLWPTLEDRAIFFARLAAEGTLRNIELRFYAKDRTPRQCLVSCEPIELDGTPCLVTVGTDITEQKRATEALHLSEQHLKSIFETSPECIKLVGADGTLLQINAAGLAMIEADRAEDVLGRNVYDLVAPSHREAFQAMNERVCRGGKESLVFEVIGLRGTPRWMETHAVPLRNPSDGGVVHLAIARDITERKRAEDSLRQQEHTLQQAREERERISQDLHDNILQSLYAVGMQLEASKIVAGKSARKAKTHITHAVDQLNHLVQEVRHFIALLRKRATAELDFGLALRQLVASFSSTGHTGPTLDIDPSAISLIRPEVGEQLFSIAREALSNSVRHARAAHRSVALRLIGTTIQLCVCDDGIGFTPGSAGNRGQGLANIAARAKQIGARLTLSSSPGEGTCVTIDVPGEQTL